jgi:peptidoglycan-N-acetylglucosamine deacetylase
MLLLSFEVSAARWIIRSNRRSRQVFVAHRRSFSRSSSQRAARFLMAGGALCCASALVLWSHHLRAQNALPLKPVRHENSETRVLIAPATAPVTKPKAIALPAEPSLETIPNWAKGRVVNHGYTEQKYIALTFDDGPQPHYTRQILDILAAHDIRATFFMIGKMVKAYPKLAREVRDGGHAIGNHTWGHPSEPKNPRAEVDDTNAILEKTLGIKVELFRPPYGILNNGMAPVARQEKQTVVLWNSVSSDWAKTATAETIYTQTLKLARPGGIVLLHDGGGDRSATIAALPRIIKELSSQGYRFVTIPELLALSKAPQPRKVSSKTRVVKKRAGKNSKPIKAKAPKSKPLVSSNS